MSLLDDVQQQLEVDEVKAVRGLGALFIAIRMAVDAKTFSLVAAAFPNAGEWMQEAPLQGGRTGEMLAMATPGAVIRILGFAGYPKDQVPAIGALVGGAVKDIMPPAAYRELVATLPMLEAK